MYNASPMLSGLHPRRRRAIRWPALLLALVCAAPAQAGKLAVFRIDPLGVDTQIVARLEGLFRLELSRLADAAMPTPAQIQEALRQKPELQNCTGDVQCLSDLGGLLKVEQVISGNVGGLGESYVVNLKIVDVTARKELRRIQEPISGRPDELIEAVRVAAYGLVAPDRLRGALSVLADQPGAEVYLSGKPVGKTPLHRLDGLPVGSYVLRVSKAGYADVVEQVRVRFQKTAQIVVKLQVPLKVGRAVARPTARPVPWYARWWFWTIIGVAAAGTGAALGYGIAGRNHGVNCDADMSRCGH
jgi:hypothetical protein